MSKFGVSNAKTGKLREQAEFTERVLMGLREDVDALVSNVQRVKVQVDALCTEHKIPQSVAA